MRSRQERRRGFLVADALGAILLILAAAGMLVYASYRYVRWRNDAMFDRALWYAAEGQLLRYGAGAPRDSRPPTEVVPDSIELQTTVAPAADEWQGLTKVTVTASGTSRAGRSRRVAVCAFLPEAPP
jgi:hypothetical protein